MYIISPRYLTSRLSETTFRARNHSFICSLARAELQPRHRQQTNWIAQNERCVCRRCFKRQRTSGTRIERLRDIKGVQRSCSRGF